MTSLHVISKLHEYRELCSLDTHHIPFRNLSIELSTASEVLCGLELESMMEAHHVTNTRIHRGNLVYK
jgi:hypothetical protein